MAARGKASLTLFEELSSPPGPGEVEGLLREAGFAHVAGVDEAGRGPLAGPVVAAAVILDEEKAYPGVADSKRLNKFQRERAFWLVVRRARAVGLGLVGREEIDRSNILQAALAAMAQAVRSLDPAPSYVLVDGPAALPLDLPQRPIRRGDSLVLSIAAASVVAKVVRDRLMQAYDRLYPEYGFASHKGYATRAHLEALGRLGPCTLHRQSFRPVRCRQ